MSLLWSVGCILVDYDVCTFAYFLMIAKTRDNHHNRIYFGSPLVFLRDPIRAARKDEANKEKI